MDEYNHMHAATFISIRLHSTQLLFIFNKMNDSGSIFHKSTSPATLSTTDQIIKSLRNKTKDLENKNSELQKKVEENDIDMQQHVQDVDDRDELIYTLRVSLEQKERHNNHLITKVIAERHISISSLRIDLERKEVEAKHLTSKVNKLEEANSEGTKTVEDNSKEIETNQDNVQTLSSFTSWFRGFHEERN